MSPRSNYASSLVTSSDRSLGATWRRLKGSKTFWTAVIALVTAVGGYASGDIEIEVLIGAVLGVAAIVFQRDASGKAIEAAEESSVAAHAAKAEATKARIEVDQIERKLP